MEFIVDVQGFKTDGNSFIFKEFAFSEANSDESITWYLLTPPFPWSQLTARYRGQNLWLTRNYHGLRWDSGYSDYQEAISEIGRILSTSITIYVKGLEKRGWLSKEFPHLENIINLEDLECPSLTKLRADYKSTSICTYHSLLKSSYYNCALENVTFLKNWLKNKYRCNSNQENK